MLICDVVNFNADASCLEYNEWLKIIRGGKKSIFCKWLQLYVKNKRKVNLGLTGFTILDLLRYNPESINYINDNNDVFQIIIRTLSHDCSSLRISKIFELNLILGKNLILKTFKNVCLDYLPSEFMFNNSFAESLVKEEINSIWILPSRFDKKFKFNNRVYKLDSFIESNIVCNIFDSELTDFYLKLIQKNENHYINIKREISLQWRDGESIFFLPDSLERETDYLVGTGFMNSFFVSEYKQSQNKLILDKIFYPPHPLNSWIGNFESLELINRTIFFENKLNLESKESIFSFLCLINSDINSSIAKPNPTFNLKDLKNGQIVNFTLNRTDRWIEGEFFLWLFENECFNDEFHDKILSSNFKYKEKYLNRFFQFCKLYEECYLFDCQ